MARHQASGVLGRGRPIGPVRYRSAFEHGLGYVPRRKTVPWRVRDSPAQDRDVYFLGPRPFMRNVKRYLKELGVPEAQTRYEFFGPEAAV